MNCPAFSFLIENAPTGRKILFDLGVSKSWENGPKVMVGRIKNGGWDVTVEKDVADILRDGAWSRGVSRLLFGGRIATLFLSVISFKH